MDILLLEPYYGGSHRQWVDGYKTHSRHRVNVLTLPAQAWKWRMQGGAVTLARLYHDGGYSPDVILSSDMMDLSTFRALTRDLTADIPIALYFHENQLTYPQNSRQGHGWRYGFINYVSAMAADAIYFNSEYHRTVFFETLPKMLKHFYDYNELDSIDPLKQRSFVLPVGMDLVKFDMYCREQTDVATPLIVWNHRWEEDKNPEAFFRALNRLSASEVDFRVAILGENTRHHTPVFNEIRNRLGERLIAFGFLSDFSDYARLLWQADYVVTTAIQEFFGVALAEAMYCECVPIAPKRLNYPYLIPPELHEACLIQDDLLLATQLQRHLHGELTVNGAKAREAVTPFDWRIVAPLYDKALIQLAQRPQQPLEW
ncbi:MAG: DUF3524 domain-containing protein [Chloroflexota bacterium]